MIYRATLEDRVTGLREVMKLGQQAGVVQACAVAQEHCPANWRVIDVRAQPIDTLNAMLIGMGVQGNDYESSTTLTGSL
jgi:hypothetical protein